MGDGWDIFRLQIVFSLHVKSSVEILLFLGVEEYSTVAILILTLVTI